MSPHEDQPRPPSLSAFGDPSGRRVFDGQEALARLDAWKARIDQTANAANDMSERLKTLTATGTDENGIAEAMVDAQGNLIGLALAYQIQRLDPTVTAQGVLDATKAAKANLAEAIREIVADTLGSESDSGKMVLSSLDDRLGLDPDGDGRQTA